MSSCSGPRTTFLCSLLSNELCMDNSISPHEEEKGSIAVAIHVSWLFSLGSLGP